MGQTFDTVAHEVGNRLVLTFEKRFDLLSWERTTLGSIGHQLWHTE